MHYILERLFLVLYFFWSITNVCSGYPLGKISNNVDFILLRQTVNLSSENETKIVKITYSDPRRRRGCLRLVDPRKTLPTDDLSLSRGWRFVWGKNICVKAGKTNGCLAHERHGKKEATLPRKKGPRRRGTRNKH